MPSGSFSQIACPPDASTIDCSPYQTIVETVYLDDPNIQGWFFPQCPITITYGISTCTDLNTGQVFFNVWGPSFNFNGNLLCDVLDSYALKDQNGNYSNVKLKQLQQVLLDKILLKEFYKNPVLCPSAIIFKRTVGSCYSHVRWNTGEYEMIFCGGEALCCATGTVCANTSGLPIITWDVEANSSVPFCPTFPPNQPGDVFVVPDCERFCD